ncbi:MAG: M48 family peptidase [Candidatus Dadabacteria bacterium]|nr:MAG: M48 family peptidase [Candidatus Dadabacteria bacterium]
MQPEHILIIYFCLFALALSADLGLELLNISHVNRNRDNLPAVLEGSIDPDTFKRSTDYTLDKARVGVLATIYDAVWLLLVVCNGWFGKLDSLLAGFVSGTYWRGYFYILILSFLVTLVNIPFDLYSTFRVEEKYGFNRMTLRLWLSDFAKGQLLSAALLLPLLFGLFWFMDKSGSSWWLYAFGFVALYQILLMYLYPVVIMPVFNRFTPLEDGELKEQIEEVAERADFKTSGVFLMDGSRRSAHGNAFFTGLGSNKRIVLFDTLIKQLGTKEILAVLAHEIGHEKMHHIKKGMLISLGGMLAGFFVLAQLLNYQPLYQAFGFEGPAYHAALVIFALIFSPVMFFIGPFFNLISRKFEYQADSFAVKLTGDYRPLADALIELSKKNLSNLNPHPLYSFVHYSHPTLVERIEAMRAG